MERAPPGGPVRRPVPPAPSGADVPADRGPAPGRLHRRHRWRVLPLLDRAGPRRTRLAMKDSSQPGSAKATSMTSAPPTRLPSRTAVSVATGSMALGSAWRRRAPAPDRPRHRRRDVALRHLHQQPGAHQQRHEAELVQRQRQHRQRQVAAVLDQQRDAAIGRRSRMAIPCTRKTPRQSEDHDEDLRHDIAGHGMQRGRQSQT